MLPHISTSPILDAQMFQQCELRQYDEAQECDSHHHSDSVSDDTSHGSEAHDSCYTSPNSSIESPPAHTIPRRVRARPITQVKKRKFIARPLGPPLVRCGGCMQHTFTWNAMIRGGRQLRNACFYRKGDQTCVQCLAVYASPPWTDVRASARGSGNW
ncbi:hypothetical protein FIBSPDRAFT_1052598 [Athelia psychrophila]|uniref:Uncharacterized protein n=1 Tax=Athelia psychrophila TaxID=1759441 RepID=A0A165X1N3_9AGAM|nr:hypothetical protein FIBSPDRAFT_1052598 [Fibularhizoctonia sp. CBS 109695]